MWKLFFSFGLLLFDLNISICTDNPNNITLAIIHVEEDGKNYFICNSSKTYTLLEGEAAEMIVNHKHLIQTAWCSDTENENINYTGGFISRTTQTRLSIVKTQATQWMCIFLMLRDIDLNSTVIYDNLKYTQVYCTFNVHIRLLNGPSILINKVPVETKRLDVLTSEYDYVGFYYFQPDLPVHIKCFQPQENAGSLQLTLKSASTGYVFANKSHEYMNTEIFGKLTKEQDNSYLDCLYETDHDVLRVRVHMYVLKKQITEKEYFIWLIVPALLVLVVLLLILCLVCKRRRRKQKSQRPQLPLPESLELDTFPGASQNQEEHEYEEIPDTVTRSLVPDRRQPDTVTRPGVPDRNQPNTVTRPGIPDRRHADTVTRLDIPDRRQLRRIPDMRLDSKNGRLIVKGKAIDLQKLLREADYVET